MLLRYEFVLYGHVTQNKFHHFSKTYIAKFNGIKNVNGVLCKVVESEWDVYFDMALLMLDEIMRNNAAGKSTVMIVPVGPTEQYPILARLVNQLNVSLKNVHFFQL